MTVLRTGAAWSLTFIQDLGILGNISLMIPASFCSFCSFMVMQLSSVVLSSIIYSCPPSLCCDNPLCAIASTLGLATLWRWMHSKNTFHLNVFQMTFKLFLWKRILINFSFLPWRTRLRCSNAKKSLHLQTSNGEKTWREVIANESLKSKVYFYRYRTYHITYIYFKPIL